MSDNVIRQTNIVPGAGQNVIQDIQGGVSKPIGSTVNSDVGARGSVFKLGGQLYHTTAQAKHQPTQQFDPMLDDKNIVMFAYGNIDTPYYTGYGFALQRVDNLITIHLDNLVNGGFSSKPPQFTSTFGNTLTALSEGNSIRYNGNLLQYKESNQISSVVQVALYNDLKTIAVLFQFDTVFNLTVALQLAQSSYPYKLIIPTYILCLYTLITDVFDFQTKQFGGNTSIQKGTLITHYVYDQVTLASTTFPMQVPTII